METRKERTFKDLSLEEKQKTLVISSLVLVGVLLLCYFFGWCYVWNSDFGAEVGVNGWNCIIACLTWSFSNPAGVYGDMHVPFNHYAKAYMRVLAVATMISFVILIAFAVLTCLNVKKYNKKIEKVSMILLYVLAASFLACIIIALVTNGSRILRGYCNNNPKCSIQTLAFFPFFITLASAIAHSVFIVRVKEDNVQTEN